VRVRQLERLTKICENLADELSFGDERNEPDVVAAVRAQKGKLLPDSGHEFRPGDP